MDKLRNLLDGVIVLIACSLTCWKREKRRLEKGQGSRFELGTAASLKKLKASWQDYRYEFDVRIVQPGLSRAAVNEEGLHLLAGVETYLLETRAMKLRVIGSA
ncbi:hypothetical protein P4152_16365 [Pseudomonas aeruginosa]|nr:hypothetical protein [Pseudomonas aeruginosa]